MTALADLLTNCRNDLLGDVIEPYLWVDADLTRYATEAIREACIRAAILKRVTTKSIIAATATYTIDASIRQILVTKLDLATTPLIQTTDAELSINIGSNWRTKTGTPTHYVRSGHSVTLYPVPIVNDILTISSSNVPDVAFSLDTDIDPVYHPALMYYMAYKALSVPADTNPILAETLLKSPIPPLGYLAMFDAQFGVKKSARYYEVAHDTPVYGAVSGGRMC